MSVAWLSSIMALIDVQDEPTSVVCNRQIDKVRLRFVRHPTNDLFMYIIPFPMLRILNMSARMVV
jgi:hypothetical protein